MVRIAYAKEPSKKRAKVSTGNKSYFCKLCFALWIAGNLEEIKCNFMFSSYTKRPSSSLSHPLVEQRSCSLTI
ncbi:hypothetical protein L596_020486 [Steinernema carpocapsae]|uniref:Uncharacterized protein n=1 Tax=Steinernema carpocapsae TaxID=34508 RepID=A0A4U5MUC7_STECR|nr:hypothetical protein L596_020486 [Steinernema carpocapsae]